MGWSGTNPADWVDRQKRNLRAIFQTATQSMLTDMGTGRGAGGLIPVDTGNLARSAIVEVGKAVSTKEDENFTGPDAAAIATLDLGDTAYLGWQAVYGRRVNYGFSGEDALGRTYNQSGAGFAESIAAKWPTYVNEAVRDAGG